MPDPRFFSVSRPFTIGELAEIGKARLLDDADRQRQILDVAPLDKAGPTDLSFIDNPRYGDLYRQSKAGGCVVSPDRVDMAPPSMTVLISDDPYLSYARMATAFYPPEGSERMGAGEAPFIHPSAELGTGGSIAAGVVIGKGASIGNNVTIEANAVIGPGVIIGSDCHIGALSSVFYCIMGNNVRLFAGARIGEAGFGFAIDKEEFLTVPQLGRVLIEDNVEIGANTTIDRGAGPDTVIGRGCRIDNLVQIGHNVRLGRNCVIVSQTGISGSTVLDDFVMVGGQVGMAGHLTVGKGVRIGAQSGVMKDIADGESVIGSPAVPARQFMRQTAVVSRLARQKGDKNG